MNNEYLSSNVYIQHNQYHYTYDHHYYVITTGQTDRLLYKETVCLLIKM